MEFIYVVFGESGDYSDNERWVVKHFRAGKGEIGHWESEGLNEYYRMVYTRVDYSIEKVEIEY